MYILEPEEIKELQKVTRHRTELGAVLDSLEIGAGAFLPKKEKHFNCEVSNYVNNLLKPKKYSTRYILKKDGWMIVRKV